jgi:hypothetical protein
MDGNRLRLWYWGYDLAEIGPLDTTYHVHLVGADLHPDSDHWGIGTSEYLFSNMTTSFEENYSNLKSSKNLIKIVDILGREIKGTKNKLLFYIYDDGTVEKRIIFE